MGSQGGSLGTGALRDSLAQLRTLAVGDSGPWGLGPWAPRQGLVTPPGGGSILNDDQPNTNTVGSQFAKINPKQPHIGKDSKRH